MTRIECKLFRPKFITKTNPKKNGLNAIELAFGKFDENQTTHRDANSSDTPHFDLIRYMYQEKARRDAIDLAKSHACFPIILFFLSLHKCFHKLH